MPAGGRDDAPRARRRALAAAVAAALIAIVALLLWVRDRDGGGSGRPGGETDAPGRTLAAAPIEPLRLRARSTAPTALTLRGRVVTVDGAPVEGATVRLRAQAAGLPALVAEVREQRSAAGGEFAFDEVAPGDYVVDAHTAEAAALARRVHLGASTPPVVLRLAPAAGLEVTVVAADDQRPIPGASVRVIDASMHGDTVARTGTTDGAGVARMRGLSPGSYALVVEADGFRPRDQPIRPQAGLRWRVRVALARGAPVTGRVVDDTGTPVPGARVWPMQARVLAGAAYVPEPKAWMPHATTDEHGEFRWPALDPLPAGEWAMMATHPRALPGASDPFSSDGRSPVSGIVIELERGRAIAGRVVDADGLPVPGAVVRVAEPRQTAPGMSTRAGLADERGAFRIAGLPVGELEVVARTEDASSETLLVGASKRDETDLELVLAHTARIAGRVVDADGAPIPDAQVMCVGQMQGEAVGLRPNAPETADADGRFACRGLPPGDYALTAMRPYPNNNQSPWMRSAGAMADAGDEDVELVLPEDGALSGKVRRGDGATVTEFTVGVDDGGAPRPFSSPDGSFTLDGLAPRSYDVVITAPRAVPEIVSDVQVPEGGTADLGTVVVGAR